MAKWTLCTWHEQVAELVQPRVEAMRADAFTQPYSGTSSHQRVRPNGCNWMFAGSDEGARQAAVLYAIFATCALCNVDPWQYLRDVLTQLAGDLPKSRLPELLPDVWAETRRVPVRAAA